MDVLLDAPISISWDITHRCNLNCQYCYNGPHKQKNNSNNNLINKITDEILDRAPTNLCFSGGEPLLEGKILEQAERLKQTGIQLSLLTSGQVNDTETLHKAANTFNLIQISLDGASPETNDRTRGRGTFEQALNSISILNEAGFKNIRLSCVLTRLNIDDFHNIVALACKYEGIKSIVAQRLILAGAAKHRQDLIPSPSQWIALSHKIKGANRHATSQKTLLSLDPFLQIKRDLALNNLPSQLHIMPDGSVRPHPFISYHLGTLKKDSLNTVWLNFQRDYKTSEYRKTASEIIETDQGQVELLTSHTNLLADDTHHSDNSLTPNVADKPRQLENWKCYRKDQNVTIITNGQGSFFVLNRTAKEILALCTGDNTISKIHSRFKSLYPKVDPEQLTNDIQEILRELKKSHVITS